MSRGTAVSAKRRRWAADAKGPRRDTTARSWTHRKGGTSPSRTTSPGKGRTRAGSPRQTPRKHIALCKEYRPTGRAKRRTGGRIRPPAPAHDHHRTTRRTGGARGGRDESQARDRGEEPGGHRRAPPAPPSAPCEAGSRPGGASETEQRNGGGTPDPGERSETGASECERGGADGPNDPLPPGLLKLGGPRKGADPPQSFQRARTFARQAGGSDGGHCTPEDPPPGPPGYTAGPGEEGGKGGRQCGRPPFCLQRGNASYT